MRRTLHRLERAMPWMWVAWVPAAVLIWLFAVPAVHADHGPPANDPLVVESLQIAAGYWGQEKAGAHVAWGEDRRFDDPGFDGHATGELGGTDITLDPRRWGAPFGYVDCQRIVHEYGHLLGHEHDDAQHPIMVTADERGLVPACDRFGVPTFTAWEPGMLKGRYVQLQRIRRTFRVRAGQQRSVRYRKRAARRSASSRKRPRAWLHRLHRRPRTRPAS